MASAEKNGAQTGLHRMLIAGVDEAGRGPLAGPVMAAAVILDPEQPIVGLADSKLLSERQRRYLYQAIKEKALNWSVASASPTEIDHLNILQATLLAMRRAINGLSYRPDQVLVDGNRLPDLNIPAQAIVKGDSKIPAISAASILAKVDRDMLMLEYHERYPEYSFHLHKGYGTKLHLEALKSHGPIDIHRLSFQPIKSMLAGTE